ncbi:methylated-DNA--[protein]-cysteine S-methyltransferase [Cohnella zeiphila]|uniref:Methylated-DNA--protein-cysteine methyltransferase n=1 Tax=Cohnella zeiphila TaxID=2761120 RepID=A0A7X0VXL3_9BACL|nr:methylated-DNA--[protein]-cysteine S-methyltransferase [Cohnella zeiphila]MBB6734409.1 methylated-DNA--[protein]-cysteine S-methyltransferase [Cohnella zeiphila]
MDSTATEVYWAAMEHSFFQDQPLYLAATKQGLCRINWPSESIDTLRSWVNKKIPNALLIQDTSQLTEYMRQLKEYLEGGRKVFSLPIDLRGTSFQISVWQALTRIPYGETRSYSDIANMVNGPKAVRAVGTANGANPIPIVIPCHRVIGKNTELTGFAGGLKVKEALLNLEGYDDYIRKGHERFLF